MDSLPSSDAPASRISFVTPDGQSLAAPREWQPAFVVLDVALVEWDRTLLRCQGQALPIALRRIGGQARIVAEWPRSSVGHYGLHLTAEGMTEDRVVTILSEKISPQATDRLLLDLETELPAIIALSLQRLGAFAGLHLQPAGETTLAQELARLHRAVSGTVVRPGLTTLLPRFQADPYRRLHTIETWTSWERARRPHPSRLSHAIACGPQFAPDRPPERVLDSRVEHTVDVYENRLVNVYYTQVLRRLRRLGRVLQLDADMRSQITTLQLTLETARRRAPFLSDVSLPAHMPSQLTMVLQKHPDYRAALEGFLELHRSPVIRLDDPRLDAPFNNLPSLYQTWGTLQVVAMLLDVAVEQGYVVHTQRLVGLDSEGVFVRLLPDGQPVLTLRHPITGTNVCLTPERTYTRTGLPLRSVSFEQRPDIAVEVVSASDAPTRVILFDPKYKLDDNVLRSVSTPLKPDIDKMHTYRDAIRDAQGRHVVHSAHILYPGQTVLYGEEIGALGADPLAPALLHTHLRDIFQSV